MLVPNYRMKALNFYHQKRKDGGLRTGVDLNGERIPVDFQSGRLPPDPALEWFVDVRCCGRKLPDDPDAIRQWLLAHGGEIQAHLERMAEQLRAGIDTDWPFTSNAVNVGNGIEMKIVCSAVRRLTGREIGRVLLDLKRLWPRLVTSLPEFCAEAAA